MFEAPTDSVQAPSRKKLAVVHVVNSLSVEHGGPSYSIPATARALRNSGVDVLVRTLAAPADVNDLRCVTHLPDQRGFGTLLRASSDMLQSLKTDARTGAILHAHGLWLMPNVYPAWAKQRSSGAARLVYSTRGMLSAEARRFSAWRKHIFWLLCQRSALHAADCLHATAAQEYEDIRSAGLRNPVAVIPNAVELPGLRNATPEGAKGERVVLSLGRVSPIKQLDNLIRAWSLLETDFPAWRLRITGPPVAGLDAELRSLARTLGALRVSIEGARYGNDKTAAYDAAHLFVLPSRSENFGLTVAEALAAEVPVISTKGAPWRGLETHRCGWWIDHGVEPLAAALRHAMSLSDQERRAMGARGRDWVASDFSWDKVARDLRDVYQWLRFGGDAPATVIFD